MWASYELRQKTDERAAVEADFDQLPPTEDTPADDISTVVSVRLRGDELSAIEQAADAASLPLSTFIRQAAPLPTGPMTTEGCSSG